MNPYRVTDSAQSDLEDIWGHISRENPANADRFLIKIYQMFQLLADHPRAGLVRHEFGLALRSYPIGKYLIFYRVVEHGIEIRRVVHGQRNLRDTLKE